jgi:hypothetical protein
MTPVLMSLDYDTLVLLRHSHPAWRLLCAEQAPLVASFLYRVYLVPNVRVIAQSDLVEALEDELFALRERSGPNSFPKSATEYLNDWAANDKGWLRKFYRNGSDEPQFDLTPNTEKAISWLASLAERRFVGTESRLLTLFELLKQIAQGSETNPDLRIAELKRRREELDLQIARIEEGDVPVLDDTGIKDRFQQFAQVARELLGDFREVEQNFRGLDRRVRERIAMWDEGKGALIEEIMGERDAIADSDQGRSFRSFWDFLMSSRRQEELTKLLDRVLTLPAVADLQPDQRLKRVHYDWLEAGEHTQRTVAQLSQQLRRFLDDAAWLENRRIMDILRSIEQRALAMRGNPPDGDVMELAAAAAEVELPMERPLYKPTEKARITQFARDADASDLDAAVLFSQFVIDKTILERHIRQSLQERSQITLTELIETKPLEHGLAELVAYLQLSSDRFQTAVDEGVSEVVAWQAGGGLMKQARLPRIIFMR